MSRSSGGNWFEKINSLQKLLICVIIGVAVYFLMYSTIDGNLTRGMIGWDTFCICMITMSWITFSITKSSEIRLQAKKQDPKRDVVFVLIVVAITASILAVILMILVKQEGAKSTWRTPVAISGMVLSWFMTHTIYALRYAHIYYGNDPDNRSNHAGGLKFPEDKKPEYFDFAYFSFVLGMTFQVSDVEITSKAIRQIAMWHGLISFAYNTIILAVTINVTMS